MTEKLLTGTLGINQLINRLIEAVLMCTQNLCFEQKEKKEKVRLILFFYIHLIFIIVHTRRDIVCVGGKNNCF